ncbi:hypothetical protein [Haloterrigena alkaliphila]|uniref:Uncharacterized protein n=1 Tax=Haloterrigena alkaliphila TaxID=2816475 RepID=A0A8A2VGC5_9EURY|nr:hypothetical protein [Haloterrigena alkaliphila]QSX00377.1 hypothetical protein J0X25_05260 [Haloterrigena alkaliphila]
MTNTLTKLGVAFVLLGVVAMVGPAFGITSLTADRSMQVSAADTPATAYLGISDRNPSEINRSCTYFITNSCDSNEVETIDLENNVDVSFNTVTVEVASVTGADDSILRVANDAELTELDPEDPPQSVKLECGKGGGTATDTEVTLLLNAAGPEVSVAEATHTVDGISYDCDEDDSAGDGKLTDDPVPIDSDRIALQLVEGTPEAEAPTGLDSSQGDSRVAFELENAGSGEMTVTGITVTDATDATHVNMIDGFIWPSDGDEVTITNDATGETATINLEGSLSVSTDRYDLSSSATAGSGERLLLGLEQFRDGENGGTRNQVDMSGESVTVVLYVEGADPNHPTEEIPVEIPLDL